MNIIKNCIKSLVKYVILFIIFGSIYYAIECLWRGYSDYRMMLVGGGCAVIIGLINNVFSWDTSFILQCFIGMLVVTLAEAIFGSYWISQDIYIWDYSNLPLSFVNGTINVFFSCAWFLLSAVCIVLDDMIRAIFFHEEFKGYKL